MSTRVADAPGLIARLVLGAVLLVAGALKITTPEAMAKATQAYQLLPHELAAYVGYALPTVEVVLGLLACGLWLSWRPSSPFSVEGALFGVPADRPTHPHPQEDLHHG